MSTEAEAIADDDDLVQIEKEYSAWDVLENRFKQNAEKGNYLDLTDESDGGARVLSVADAEKDCARVRKNEEASQKRMRADYGEDCGSNEVGATAATTVSSSASCQNTLDNDDAVTKTISTLVHNTVDDLREARERLQKSMVQCKYSNSTNKEMKRKRKEEIASSKRLLHELVVSIDKRTRAIQVFVNQNSDAVMTSQLAVEKIEKMNMLITKANALIEAVNQKNTKGSKRSKRTDESGIVKEREIIEID
eukprot:scaffold11660_cov62-Cyclotella_meneghiniana.AAC.2